MSSAVRAQPDETQEPDPAVARERIEEYLARDETEAAADALDELPATETSWALAHLGEDEKRRLFDGVSPEAGADLIERLSDEQAADVLECLEPAKAAAILRALRSEDRADVLAEMGARDAEAVLATMAPAEAEQARRLCEYDPDSAGGLMASEFLLFRSDQTAGDVVRELRARAEELEDYAVQYAYVADPDLRLAGVLRLRDLLLAPDHRGVRELMIPRPLTVRDDATLDELEDFFEKHNFLGVPVVDAQGRMLGVVRRAAVEEALGERAEDDFRKSQGIVGGEEFRSMPLRVRAWRRLSWLSANIGLNLASASVIAFYQGTLEQVIALAVFLPILSDMSGCSGSQAVAVSIRELALGLIKTSEVARVWLQEVKVGLVNGALLGLLLAAVAWLWKGNPWLGAVVGGALFLNTLVAVSIGGLIPLFLKRLGRDPALASGPLLTTVTDMCGFFLVLSLASAALPRLTG